MFLKMLFIFAWAMLNKLLVTIFIILGSFLSNAQDTVPQKMVFQAGIHRGFLIAHRPLIVPLQQRHTTGFEASLLMKTDGSKPWHQVFGFPDMGITLLIWDLGNKDQLGAGVSLVPFIDFPLAKGRKTEFDLKFGWGIGYVEKIFDADENYKNVAIGTHLNCALILQPHIKTRISKRFDVNAGLSMAHFSNGAVATPNLGLNLLSVTAGLSYKFGQPLAIDPVPLPPFVKSRRFSLFIGGGTKQTYPADGNNYFAFSISGNQSWQIARKSAFGFGADIFYDNSITKKLEEEQVKHINSLETMRLGVHGSYEMTISKISLLFNLGGYVYSEYVSDGTFYQRVGIRYRITDKLFAAMHLKAHWGKADFIEWGIGYRIDKFKTK